MSQHGTIKPIAQKVNKNGETLKIHAHLYEIVILTF